MRFPRIPPMLYATVSQLASLARGRTSVSALRQLVIERAMVKQVDTKALQAFELTWVVYDPKDPIGLAMAFFTLAPVCVPRRVVLLLILLVALARSRPLLLLCRDRFVTLMQVSLFRDRSFSSDRNGCTWRQMISEVLNKVLKKSINQRRPTGARMSGSGMPSAHSQFSSFFASYAVAYTWSRYVPLFVMLQSLLKNSGRSRLAQFFYLRDISHIPDLIVYQHELCHSAVASLQTVLP
ncbi:hypothetical protein BBJ28_00000580 [Nothophytophthora sp. Chile5]|nr:hypothetical protein BBJ28_00000580 [Nothophytophthora sp. Chile5]